jgi:hypothetical protein
VYTIGHCSSNTVFGATVATGVEGFAGVGFVDQLNSDLKRSQTPGV